MSAPSTPPTRVDHSALRTNQASVIVLLLIAFLLGEWRPVALVSGALLVGAIAPALAPFKALYALMLKPAGLVRPDVREDSPAPHRFAQLVGGVVTAASAVALASGWRLTGWGLTWLVIALAALNLFAGICVGCLLYFQLARLRRTGTSPAPSELP
jgi:hypothetical protein